MLDGERILTYHSDMRAIAHVDADCFYVSCERIRDPSLIGKPVGVLGNQGSCVIARSYEMKARGVTVAMPVRMAKNICPEAIYIKRDFEWYGVISHQIQEILQDYTPNVEFYSVDESFMDFGETDRDLYALAKDMQNRVLREAHIPVSIGFAQTRILAKIGSDKNKPFGITVMTPENLKQMLLETPVADIHGVGHRSASQLIAHGIHNAFDYVQTKRRLIRTMLHKPGEEIWYELQGKSILPIRNERAQRKTLSRGGQLWGVQKDPKIIYGFLIRNLERFVESLWHYQMEIKNFIVVMITDEGRAYQKEDVFSDFTDDYNVLIAALKKGFLANYRASKSYSAVHLISTQLRGQESKQLNLFTQKDPRRAALKAAKTGLSERFGPFALRSASSAFVPEVFADESSNYEICDIDGKVCF